MNFLRPLRFTLVSLAACSSTSTSSPSVVDGGASKGGACVGAMPDTAVPAYAGAAHDPTRASCPAGQYRASDYVCNPAPDAGQVCTDLTDAANDGACHVVCRCDADCPNTAPHCASYAIHRGSDVPQRTVSLCRE